MSKSQPAWFCLEPHDKSPPFVVSQRDDIASSTGVVRGRIRCQRISVRLVAVVQFTPSGDTERLCV